MSSSLMTNANTKQAELLATDPTASNLAAYLFRNQFSLKTGLEDEEGRLHLRNLKSFQEVTDTKGFQSRNRTSTGTRKIMATLTTAALWIKSWGPHG